MTATTHPERITQPRPLEDLRPEDRHGAPGTLSYTTGGPLAAPFVNYRTFPPGRALPRRRDHKTLSIDWGKLHP